MSITNPQSARVIETLSDKVFELSAKLVLQELQTKKKGGRAIILSSAKIRRPMELGQDKVIEKEQQQQDKEVRAAARAVQKALMEAEVQKERNDQATTCLERQQAAATMKTALQKAFKANKAQKELKQKMVKKIKEPAQKATK
ncbi:MAG: hypothetical protein FE78DRAFT_27914 [Acidomyces sp. 'richmondensis']|nr:MAG: hypothetical protein FE78DRAFT_27914 [Acidomyces sp. 'richmondensis']